MTHRIRRTPQALLDAVGTDLGTTDWITITQEQINQFAEATLDNQWIHVDTERAKAGPFGAPIAHGYLTMSLAAYFLRPARPGRGHLDGHQLRRRQGALPVAGAGRLEAAGRGELLDAKEVPGGVQTTIRITIEREGGDKPAAIVDTTQPVPRMTLAGRVLARRARSRSSPARAAASAPQTARTYAEAGADLVLAARTKEQLDAVAEEVRGFGRARARDPVRRRTRTKRSKTSSRRRWPSSAASTSSSTTRAARCRARSWTRAPGYLERAFHFNVTTAFVLSKAAAPHMLAARVGARSSTSRPRSAGSATAASSRTARRRPRSRT